MEGIQLDFLCLPGQIGDMQFKRATINYPDKVVVDKEEMAAINARRLI